MTLLAKEKHCLKCGAAFDCGGLLGCWCRDVKLDAAQLSALQENYADCLCPACLKAIADRAALDAQGSHVV